MIVLVGANNSDPTFISYLQSGNNHQINTLSEIRVPGLTIPPRTPATALATTVAPAWRQRHKRDPHTVRWHNCPRHHHVDRSPLTARGGTVCRTHGNRHPPHEALPTPQTLSALQNEKSPVRIHRFDRTMNRCRPQKMRPAPCLLKPIPRPAAEDGGVFCPYGESVAARTVPALTFCPAVWSRLHWSIGCCRLFSCSFFDLSVLFPSRFFLSLSRSSPAAGIEPSAMDSVCGYRTDMRQRNIQIIQNTAVYPTRKALGIG